MKAIRHPLGKRHLAQIPASIVTLLLFAGCSPDNIAPSIRFIEGKNYISSDCELPLGTEVTVGFHAASNMDTEARLDVLSVRIVHDNDTPYNSTTYTTENVLDHDTYFKVNGPGQYVVTGTITDENHHSASISLTIKAKE